MSLSKLSNALSLLDRCNPVDASEALDTLLIYMDNIINNPNETRFRCIRTSNTNYQERLGHLNGQFLEAVGFELNGDFLRLDMAYFSDENKNKDNLVSLGSLADLRKMRSIVQDKLTSIKSTWATYRLIPSPSYQWNSVAGFTAADDIGKRASMEDEYTAIDSFCGEKNTGFFAVYDGHGGRTAVDFIVRALHHNMEQALKITPALPMAQIFEDVYLKTDGQIRRQNIVACGSTSVTVLIRTNENNEKYCYAANVGDSRAILCRAGKAIRLTKDHKPTDPAEAERVTAQGGFVGRFGRVNGILAISRALGDHMLKSVVSASPYTSDTLLTDEDDFIILACDGVWDVVTDQEAVDFMISKVLEKTKDMISNKSEVVATFARDLVDIALEKHTMDNVTVMIVFLRDPFKLYASSMPPPEIPKPASSSNRLQSLFLPPS